MNSILTDVKSMLGIVEEDESFDNQLIMFINAAFMTLRQLGIGPVEGFNITDKTSVWTDYIENIETLSLVQPVVYMRVKLMFDNTLTGPATEAIKNQIAEYEWRLNVEVDPNTAQ